MGKNVESITQINVKKDTSKLEKDFAEEIAKSNETVDIKESNGKDQVVDKEIQIPCEDGTGFDFLIERELWETIRPMEKHYKGNRRFQKFQGDWTNIFYERSKIVQPGCTLRFNRHHIRANNSRKRGKYMTGHAYCTGSTCNAIYTFYMDEEPNENEDVHVHCTISGTINHNQEEMNRRNLSGIRRLNVKKKLMSETSTTVFYNQMENHENEMNVGNFSEVPNPNSLRKIVSEILQKEQLHDNIMKEIEILKGCYENEEDPYIHDIGFNPFSITLQNKQQVNLLKTLAKQKNLELYIDATGSVIKPIKDQKRPLLYSIVVKPNPKLPAVSVADMLVTEHTIPRIEFFLLQIKRNMLIHAQTNQIKKIETDFSFAIMQACLHAFNGDNVKSYLAKCFQISSTTPEVNPEFTVLHLCSTHIFKDFTKQLKSYKEKTEKQKLFFIKKCFALLQNATSLKEGLDIFKDICLVFLPKSETCDLGAAKERLMKKMKQEEEEVSNDDEEESILTDMNETCHDFQRLTIKAASPFNPVFEEIKTNVMMQQDRYSEVDLKENGLSCPEFVQCLLDRFMYLFPLWSGMMLSKIDPGRTRDTNSPVENYFKSLKHDIGLKKNTRPSIFIMKLKKITKSRIMELSYPQARESKKRKKEAERLMFSEERWSRKKKKKAIYQPDKKFKSKANLPEVPKWGGTVCNTRLFNTCTIDNGLTILHLQYLNNAEFKRILQESNSSFYHQVLTVLTLMTENSFDQAKIVWLGIIEKSLNRTTDLFGDETDFFIHYLDRVWESTTVSKCDNLNCPCPYEESGVQHGVNIW